MVEPDPLVFNAPAPVGVERLGRRLRGIPEGRTRTVYLHERIRGAPERPLVRLLACAQREAAAGSVEARVLLDAFGSLVAEGLLDDAAKRALVEAASEICEHGVRALIDLPEDASEGGNGEMDPPKRSLAAEGETLGRRKTLARTAHGDLFDRILQDPHPEVIRNALLNPRMNESLALRVAARRPVPGSILEVVAQSRYRTSATVRRALVLNPHCPPKVACRLISSLTRHDLLMVAHDEQLSHEVRSAARLLLEAKPPRRPG